MISNSGTTSLGLYDFKRQIDAFGGVDYFRPTLAGGYLPNARVMLNNGKIVQNGTNGNLTNNPNTDMTGWVKTNSASHIFDENGLSQQVVNSGLSSINSLRDIAPDSDSFTSVIRVNSHTEGYNIGGDDFIFLPLSELPDDNGRVIKPHSITTGRWIRLNNVVNIEQYGAIPLSLANVDSTIAIERAALSNVGKQINVSANQYKITRSFDASLNCCFSGESGSSVYELKSEFILDSVNPITLFPAGTKVQLENMCVSGGVFGITPIHNLATEWSNYGSIPMRNCRIRRFKSLGDISTTYLDFYDVFVSECIDTFYLTQNSYNESSTVIGFNSCRFTYCKNGIQTKSKSVATMPPSIGVYFKNCGFENLEEYGISGDILAMSVRDCWFENTKGKYNVTASTVIQETNVAEYFTGDSIGVNPALFSNINGIYSKLPKLQLHESLTSPRIISEDPLLIDNGVRFKDNYIAGGSSNTNALGKAIKQVFTSDGGSVSASIQFLRTNQGSSSEFQASAISFSTGRLTDYTSDPVVEQWRIDGHGNFIPKRSSLNVGSSSEKVNKVFTANANISSLATHASNSNATSAGLVAGDLYKTATGQLMVVF